MKRRSPWPALLLACTVGSAAADSLAIDGTSLVLQREDGQTLTGEAVAGHEIDIDTLQLRITAVLRGAGRAPWLYELTGHDGEQWRPVCEPDTQGRRAAAVLAGSLSRDGRFTADPGRLSIACSSGALGKCLLAGYAPVGDGAPRFQACLRMIRADYCGDGRSWTRNGVPVDLFDTVGIQVSEMPQLPLEAAWGPDGAVCVHHTRVPARLSLPALQDACPKALQLPPQDCTFPQARGLKDALLFNRSAPSP